jgi:prophage tail gpP-like protein
VIPSGAANPVDFYAGDAVDVWVGSELVVRGFAERLGTSSDAIRSTITIGGRSRTADAIDCSAEARRFRDQTILAIAEELLKPHQIEVRTTAAPQDLKPIPKLAIEPGETIFEALDRAARLQGLWIYDDPQGRMIIGRPGMTRASYEIRRGVNVLAHQGEVDSSQCFSRYLVKGQIAPRDEAFGRAAAGVEALSLDANALRDRVLILPSESGADQARAEARAQYEAAKRAGDAVSASYTLPGWTQPTGKLYAPGELVRVVDPLFRVDADMIVASCSYKRTAADGPTTDVLVTLPAAFQPRLPDDARDGVGGWRPA